MKKNLLMYFYISDTNVIDSNTFLHINFLKRYRDVFDGQKHIYVATDNFVQDKSQIAGLFDFFNGVELTFVINDPENRESKFFLEQISRLDGSESLTFYCHNKGTTGNGESESLMNWITSMYFMNLEPDYLRNIEKVLVEKTFYGTLRKDLDCSPWVCTDWHYSGTFFWFDTKKVTSKNIGFYGPGRYSVESFPGQVSRLSDSGCDGRFFYDYNFDARTPDFWRDFFNRLTSEEIVRFDRLLRQSIDGDLTRITNYLGSDKGTIVDERHSYTRVYESLFSVLRKRKVNMLEIGIKDPRFPYASVKIWDLYFDQVDIIGLDISDCRDLMDVIPNFDFIGFDQYDVSSHLNVIEKIKQKNVDLDIIIDDGPHYFEAQINSLNLFYDLLKVGGYYIIEDVHVDGRILDHIKSSNKYKYETYCEGKLIVIAKT